MNVIKAAILLALTSFAAGQVMPDEDTCESFELTITNVEFLWHQPIPNQPQREITHVPGTSLSGTNQIGWGARSDDKQSGLVATNTPVDFDLLVSAPLETGAVFQIGNVSHINWPVGQNTQLNAVTLCIKIYTDQGDFEFDYNMSIDETPNYNVELENCDYTSTTPCADRVLVLNNPEPQEISILPQGYKFELDLAGFKDTPASAIRTEFITQEEGETPTGLYASFFLTDCPGGGGSNGDPHFQTWTGNWYDFQGECDMHLLSAPGFEADTALAIDVRTKTRDWYSFIEAVAIRLGDDTLEVTGYGAYALNGVEHARLPKAMAGKYPVTHKQINKKRHEFNITIGGDEKIVVKSFKDLVSVSVVNGRGERFEGSTGMMGSFHTGLVRTRDGKVVLEDPVEIAREWQVRDDEPMLFQDAHGPQYPQRCVMPKKQVGGGRLGKTIALIAAQEACAHWKPDTIKMCVEDVMKTGDIDLAQEAM